MTESMLTDLLTFLFGVGCLVAFTRVVSAFFNRKRPTAPGLLGVSAMSLSLPQDVPGWDRRHDRTTGGRRSSRSTMTRHRPIRVTPGG